MSFVVCLGGWSLVIMESKLFDCRSISGSETVGFGGTCSNLFLSRRRSGRVGISQQLPCSSRGISFKTSCTAPISNQDIDLIGQNNFLGNGSSRINGVYSACSNLSSREVYVLDSYEDEYEGVVVDPERLPSNTNGFASILQASIRHWKLKGKKGVWLKLPVEQSELVPIAVKEGFQYHHAERGYVMLTYWIPGGPCLLPANASHQVGVGGFVINEENKVLVVQEKHCSSTFRGVWKFPTGFIHESEEIYTGAVREVKEETGIDTEFVEVIAFRHAHHLAFNKSDLFFICMLRPLSTQIVIDETEIQAAQWMPLHEFIEQSSVQGDNMFKKIIDICIARLRKRYCGLTAHHVTSKFDGRSSSLYYNVVEPQDFNCLAN